MFFMYNSEFLFHSSSHPFREFIKTIVFDSALFIWIFIQNFISVLLKYFWCSVSLKELVKFHYSCYYEMIGEEESKKLMLPACFNT